ncbi:hypothetical protein [Pseudomonas sp. FEN]|uniref:hypothetical protein n=1 Tax=Pseudomonas sp. FEN TaxID=2767468 RepID=UPI001CD6247B|nr:hypothetical protein [Pseudomonas sp. FEN]
MERYYRKNGVHYERLGEMIRHQDEQIVAIQLPTERKRHFSSLAPALFMHEKLKQSPDTPNALLQNRPGKPVPQQEPNLS